MELVRQIHVGSERRGGECGEATSLRLCTMPEAGLAVVSWRDRQSCYGPVRECCACAWGVGCVETGCKGRATTKVGARHNGPARASR